MNLKSKRVLSILCLIIGLIISASIYYSTSFVQSKTAIAKITDSRIQDVLVNKTEDNYKNKDEVRMQTMSLKILSGKYIGKTYKITNTYSPSQVVSQKYRSNQRLVVSFIRGKPKINNVKRDGILIFMLFLVISLLIYISGKKTFMLVLSMILSIVIFYFVIKLDIAENGTEIFAIYGGSAVIFTFTSLLIVQGFNKKMLVTFISTLLGVFVSFALCYLIMELTNERGIKYEAIEYATQDPRSLFLAQTILGVLGAVMDEATDIVTSLYALVQHKKNITFKELFMSGRTLGQEIMGPLINVLVLIFMAEALPITILYLRDNNTLSYAFEFALSCGVIQSLISAIGIVLTVVFSSLCSGFFINVLHKKTPKIEAK